ncbi:MAG: hypothetical protein AAGA37_13810 [Actinomycetota bacterium]
MKGYPVLPAMQATHGRASSGGPSSSRALGKHVARAEAEAVIERAKVAGVGAVASQQVQAIDSVARDALVSQALLLELRTSLAGSDPVVHEELGFFCDLARMAKSQVLADLMATLSEHTRRP